jgi:carbamoyl-phosphate synthase small subunit
MTSLLLDRPPAVLVLEDGRSFRGDAYGAVGETVGEAVFSTGMTGYQETLTDPSYHRQVVVMTAPHVGNTGINTEDPESSRIWVSGYVVRDPRVAAVELAVDQAAGGRAARPGRRRDQRHRHPGTDASPARTRCHAGGHLQR